MAPRGPDISGVMEGAGPGPGANFADTNVKCKDQGPLRQPQHQHDAIRSSLDTTDVVSSDISLLPPLPFSSTTAASASHDDPHAIHTPLGTPTLSRSNTISRSSSGSLRGSVNNSANSDCAYTFTRPPAQPQHLSHHSPAQPTAVRKTSPGLAARLRALGFGVPKQSPSPSPAQHEHIGRLDEQQLRQLDQKHLANSITSVISRRGRPWKGTGGTPTSTFDTPSSSPAQSVIAAESPQLPMLSTPEPLAMDTQKYRLPDHGNGNGTKVTLDTRREHIERGLLVSSPLDAVPPSPPPPPPPKDTPPLASTAAFASVTSPQHFVPGLDTYFNPGNNRPGSIYTLSRASFANQLAQLTSLQLPDADTLSSKVSAIPTAHVAAKALINASEQIRNWIAKAQEVIGGLDSDDDVEWAAAGGREGLQEVENAIARFEHLINAYVGAIEELQERDDVINVSADDLRRAVAQMDSILDEWAHIRATLTSVRVQVEIAMEWEQLWNTVLGDIQDELDELGRLVFEMEERRHKSAVAAAAADSVDIGHLQTMVDDSPSRIQAPNRFSLGLPMSPSSPGAPGLSQDDSSLLALFARMQPLRASLDFLPMRLSAFEARAETLFPTACEELGMRREALDASYRKLEKDAESLRKELGEDRWVIVFRGAGRQAQKMQESVERSLLKLNEAIDAEVHMQMPPTLLKKIEGYEAKKTHYGPAIERVLSIIDRGVRDRLTVNGEILRLHHDVQSRWESLKAEMQEMDVIVDDIHADRKSHPLRDSVSSVLSNDRSTVASGGDTPGSSPPSSVVMTSLGFEPQTPLPRSKGRRSPGGSVPRSAIHNSGNNMPLPSRTRQSSLPAPSSYANRRNLPRLSTVASSATATPGTSGKTVGRLGSISAHRPDWNVSTNTSVFDAGHSIRPLNPTSPYSRTTPLTQRSVSAVTPSSASKLPTLRSALTRGPSLSPGVDDSPSRGGRSRLAFRDKLTSPGPYSQQTLTKPRLTTQASMSALNSYRQASQQSPGGDHAPADEPTPRPATSFASRYRRTTLLPQVKGKGEPNGRVSSPIPPLPTRSITRKPVAEPKDSKPRWRP